MMFTWPAFWWTLGGLVGVGLFGYHTVDNVRDRPAMMTAREKRYNFGRIVGTGALCLANAIIAGIGLVSIFFPKFTGRVLLYSLVAMPWLLNVAGVALIWNKRRLRRNTLKKLENQ